MRGAPSLVVHCWVRRCRALEAKRRTLLEIFCSPRRKCHSDVPAELRGGEYILDRSRSEAISRERESKKCIQRLQSPQVTHAEHDAHLAEVVRPIRSPSEPFRRHPHYEWLRARFSPTSKKSAIYRYGPKAGIGARHLHQQLTLWRRARGILGAHVTGVRRWHVPCARKGAGAASDFIGIVGIDRWTSLVRARRRRTLETFALFLRRFGE